MTRTQTINYKPGPHDNVLMCIHKTGAPALGISSPSDLSVWIAFAPRDLPVLRRYIVALEAYEASEPPMQVAAVMEAM